MTLEPQTPEAPTPDLFETTITKLVTGGAGLGQTPDGLAAFVPGTVPGERVRAQVRKRKKGYVEAELVEILEASPDRVEPPLGEIGSQSGCDLQHMSIEAQHRGKHGIVHDCFVRLGGLDLGDRLGGPDAVGPPLGYRNKVRLWRSPLGPFGVLHRGTHDVLPIERHGLLPDVFNDEILPYLILMPPVDELVVRLDHQGRFLISLFGQANRVRPLKALLKALKDGEAPHPGCLGILYNNRPVWGRDHLVVQLAGRTYRVNAGSFFQVNYAEAAAAVETARTWLDEAGITADAPGSALLDLYGGVGLFTLALGDRFKRTILVETDRTAVPDARNNIQRDERVNGRAQVVDQSVLKVVLGWKDKQPVNLPGNPGAQGGALDWSDTTVVVDPPRQGLGEMVAGDLVTLAPARILYMSCDPATLARDCKQLTAGGYELRRAQVVDMFPMTGHVECLVELVRKAN
jgi:23S rRNA (uracil1939-C5)-methyltransferase